MSISQAVAQHLPYLRRYARALTGSQNSGDAYVVATLEALVEDPTLLSASPAMRVELYRRESIGWRGYILDQADDVVESSCLELRLDLRQIYEGVDLLPPGVAEPEPPEYAAVE